MRDERGVTFGPIVGIVVIILALVGLFALCGDGDNDVDTLGRIELVSHEYGEESRCYEGDCYDQEYDNWNSDQRNHNRRNRGSFSPGPFDRSPVDAFNGNVVCLPGSTCYADDRRNDNPPPDEREMP